MESDLELIDITIPVVLCRDFPYPLLLFV